jgi:glutamine amidotransferase
MKESMDLVIVDYGVGNLASIKNMLKKIGINSLISGISSDIESASKLILPGVGAFDTCVDKLNQSGLRETLSKRVLVDKVPILGICVGMQLLLSGSEEGSGNGLGWVGGTNVRFNSSSMSTGTRIPHMGWTEVTFVKNSPLLDGMYPYPRFYFVHSYHAALSDDADRLLTSDYGYPFAAALEHKNIIGVQFHPEKSHKFGMKLLENYVRNY